MGEVLNIHQLTGRRKRKKEKNIVPEFQRFIDSHVRQRSQKRQFWSAYPFLETWGEIASEKKNVPTKGLKLHLDDLHAQSQSNATSLYL